MSGKRILDVVALFNASRGVAQKHIALRTKQVEVYNQTSSLVRAVRNQTDRVTETVKAGSFLASRLNENAPAWASETQEDVAEGQSPRVSPIPSNESTGANAAEPTPKEGLEQDHFYERSTKHSTTDKLPRTDLDIKQETANRYPFPDGTIPPGDGDINILEVEQDVVRAMPSNETSKYPLENEDLRVTASGNSTIHVPSRLLSADAARTIQRQSELQIPAQTADALGESGTDPLEEGHDGDSFYRRSGHTSPALSSLPRVKIPKHPSNIQESYVHLPSGALNSDSYHNTRKAENAEKIPSAEAAPEEDQVPEGVNLDLFYNPRISRTLGGKSREMIRHNLDFNSSMSASIGQASIPDDKSQETFNVRSSIQKEATPPRSTVVSISDLPNFSTKDDQDINRLAADPSKKTSEESIKPDNNSDSDFSSVPYELKESKVPSSRLGRLWNYGGLAAGMFGGAISESIRRVSGNGGEGSFILSASNMDRLVTKLSRMRGAALKLGQMISFQDSKMLPAEIQEVLQRVQDRADYMPASQRNKVLASNLGHEWRELFSSFEEKPLAAASIGQVHSATLKSNGARVAVKVQYPGVSDSIDSDLNNLAILLTASRLLPKGLFLDKTIANARTELSWECDYIREAECGRRFGELLADEKDIFLVPKVYPEASGKQVLTMEFMDGVGVTRVQNFSQEQKDWIGTQILRLCLREITEFKYMQTDPNWTNFLYNSKTNKLELLDFGASRDYPDEFIIRYSKLLAAASKSDRDTVRDLSIDLGYLTGQESKAMLNAHIASVLTLAEPFLDSSPEVYDFRDQTITDRVKALIPVMIKERLAPPPEETYSLHRKLSGAFLLCARLGSRVRCRELFKISMTNAGLL